VTKSRKGKGSFGGFKLKLRREIDVVSIGSQHLLDTAGKLSALDSRKTKKKLALRGGEQRGGKKKRKGGG